MKRILLSMETDCLLNKRPTLRLVSDSGNRCEKNISRSSGDHIVRRQRPPDPLQLELAHWLDLHGILDLRQHSRADEYLPWLGFIA